VFYWRLLYRRVKDRRRSEVVLSDPVAQRACPVAQRDSPVGHLAQRVDGFLKWLYFRKLHKTGVCWSVETRQDQRM